jgi:hypothetical protein
MITIYYKSNSSRVREAAFVSWLQMHLPDAQLSTNHFPVCRTYLDRYIATQDLIDALKADNHLPKKPRQRCIELLHQCPTLLKVALEPTRISFDVVVEQDGQPYFWEFHEEQHRKLTLTRTQKVYDAQTNAPVQIPRYLQRLIRDVWRVAYFRPYTIVWHDWFAKNQNRLQPKLCEGLHEFNLLDQFSLSRFWLQNSRR